MTPVHWGDALLFFEPYPSSAACIFPFRSIISKLPSNFYRISAQSNFKYGRQAAMLENHQSGITVFSGV
jgi:hypothetical protein